MSEILESGDIQFFFRPVVEEESPEGLADVQQFTVVLSPHDQTRHRMLVVGRKRLPDIADNEPLWAYVDLVTDDREAVTGALTGEQYRTKTRGERHQPAARPAGEGVYALEADGDVRLAYLLELPDDPGPVQQVLDIAPQARYVLQVKNPEVGAPAGVGLPPQRRPEFPPRLSQHIGDRRWVPADPREFLDYEGAELLLIGAAEDPGDPARSQLEAEDEDSHSADVFQRLRLRRDKHPVRPLLEGSWD
ncbi:MAG: hypothetical protein M3N17_09720 [Actinomycetota bacterium]|nr:hypothetical protein [Actinomycetota bacterium]